MVPSDQIKMVSDEWLVSNQPMVIPKQNLLSLQLVLCRVAALKSGPYIVHSAVYILLLVL